MNLKQQIIENNIERISKKFKISKEDAFVRYAHSLILGQSTTSFDQEDIVEGGQDKQIDVITIDEEEKGTDIYHSNNYK
jgi:hypothetical protein